MRARSIVLSASCLLTGVLIGLNLDTEVPQAQAAPSNVSSAPLQATTQCPPVQTSVTAHTRPLALDDIRNVIREELVAQLAAHPQQLAEDRLEEPPGDPAAEAQQRLRYDKAHQLVRGAVNFGTWTQADRQQFRGLLHELSIPQQDQLIGELFGAIQSGRLKVDNLGPPL